MQILYSQNNLPNFLTESSYSKEEELRDYLYEFPKLLNNENDNSIIPLAKEFNLSTAGKIDILLIDSNGVPIVIECKLHKNEESRREILAQIFDYVSALSLLTTDELDEQLNGSLSSAIEIIADGDTNKYDTIWRNCATNLRAGKIRVILAVDEARDDLIRIVRFVNDHSDLDILLMTIKKYENPDLGLILVPNFVVYGAAESFSTKSKTRVPREEFESIISLFSEKNTTKEFCIQNSNPDYRKIAKKTWDASVHYEFLNRGKGSIPTIELHLENKKYAPVFSKIEDFMKSIEDKFPECNINYSEWLGGGRIILNLKDKESKPEIYADLMLRFIDLTSAKIENIISSVK